MTRTSPGLRMRREAPPPASNVYTVMLVVAFVFIVTAIGFNLADLIGRYEVDIGKAFWPF